MNAAAGPAGSIPALAARLIEHYSVDQITIALETMIAVLDYLDGDPEAEDDDPSGQCDEDGRNTGGTFGYDPPGCPISDPAEHDARRLELAR